MQSVTPECTHSGLGSSAFARRYLQNRVFFLFLRVLRCFSSPGSLPYVMDWRMDDRGVLCRVSPFRDLRIKGYLLLPEAYRSLSRLSSALSAKASALRSSSLNLHMHSVAYSGTLLKILCSLFLSSESFAKPPSRAFLLLIYGSRHIHLMKYAPECKHSSHLPSNLHSSELALYNHN